jgi:hypothetical protein
LREQRKPPQAAKEKSGRFLSDRNRLAGSSISLPATEIGWLAARHRFLSQHLLLYGNVRCPVETRTLLMVIELMWAPSKVVSRSGSWRLQPPASRYTVRQPDPRSTDHQPDSPHRSDSHRVHAHALHDRAQLKRHRLQHAHQHEKPHIAEHTPRAVDAVRQLYESRRVQRSSSWPSRQ